MKKKSIGIGLLLAVAMTGTASAAEICLKYVADGPGLTDQHFFYQKGVDANSTQSITEFEALFLGSREFSGYNNTYQLFCVQIFEGVTQGHTYCYDIVPTQDVPEGNEDEMGIVRAKVMGELYTRFHNDWLGGNYTGTDLDNRAAAFAALVWEISHETLDSSFTSEQYATLSLDMNAGAFRSQLNTEAQMLAEQALAMLTGTYDLNDSLNGLKNGKNQDQLIYVPLPAPVILAGVGLVAAGIIRRRMK